MYRFTRKFFANKGASWSRSLVNVNGSQRNGTQTPNYLLGVVAVTSLGAVLYSQDKLLSQSDCAGKNEPRNESHSITEIAMLLREKLKTPREQLKKAHKPIPTITARMISMQKRHDFSMTDCQVLDTSFAPASCNTLALIHHWMKVFDDSPTTSSEKLESKIRTFKEFYSNPNKITQPFVSEDKKKTMTITKFVAGDGPRVSITMIKDVSYTVQDIDNIAKGYEEGFCTSAKHTAANKKGGEEPLDFQLTDDHHLLGKSMDHLHENNLYKQQPYNHIIEFFDKQNDATSKSSRDHFNNNSSGHGNGNNGNHNHSGHSDDMDMFDSPQRGRGRRSVGSGASNGNGGNGNGAGTGDPAEELRSLGVEVFDQSNNAKLSWDYIAGYEYVKEDIRDTVINALKYPEIYEEIARKTRVHYESNRPKAVLLEGPPGTGKTLTARILASECEVPLVILRLESIVSKWYGDSEKKLSQVKQEENKFAIFVPFAHFSFFFSSNRSWMPVIE
jgi:hypothetical protein